MVFCLYSTCLLDTIVFRTQRFGICTIRCLNKSVNCKGIVLIVRNKLFMYILNLKVFGFFFIKINAVLPQCYHNTYSNNPLYCTFVLLCRLLPLYKCSLHLRVGDWCKCETSFDSWYLLHNFHYSNSSLQMNQKNSKTRELCCNYMYWGYVLVVSVVFRCFGGLFIIILRQ